MSKKKTFILSDESVNSYGTRVVTTGINIENYQKNPIILYNHTRGYTDNKNQILPIGRMENLRVENGQLLGEPVFDMDDPFAVQVANKVEKGILNACSIGIRVVEESDDPKNLLPGQKYATITKSILREVSIVDIPSNANAVAFYDAQGNEINLTAAGENAFPVKLITNNNLYKMKLIALKLGLKDSATEDEILAKIAELEGLKVKNEQLATENQNLKDAAKTAETASIASLVDDAIKSGKVTASNRNHFLQLGEKAGAAALKETLDVIPNPVKPTDIINRGGKGAASVPGAKKFSEMTEKELIDLRENNRAEYVKLFKDEYGVEPDID